MCETIKFTKEVYERQTTASLRDEMYGQFEKHAEDLKSEELERKDDFMRADKREDGLQKQIDGLNKFNTDKADSDYKNGQEDLMTS